MAKRYDELSIADQLTFEGLALQGLNSEKLALRFDLTYETARRQRQQIRRAAREKLAQGVKNDSND